MPQDSMDEKGKQYTTILSEGQGRNKNRRTASGKNFLKTPFFHHPSKGEVGCPCFELMIIEKKVNSLFSM